MVRASRRDGASSKENSLNSNAAREAPPYGGAVQFNRFYRDYEPLRSIRETAKHGGGIGDGRLGLAKAAEELERLNL